MMMMMVMISLPIIVGRVKGPLSVVPRIPGNLPQPVEYPRRWIEPVVRHNGETIHRRRCQIAEWHLTPRLTRNRSCFGSRRSWAPKGSALLSLSSLSFLFILEEERGVCGTTSVYELGCFFFRLDDSLFVCFIYILYYI